MEKIELKNQESVEVFKGRSMAFLTTVHIIFTILLFVAMTHVQMQLKIHIAQQEQEMNALRKMMANYEYTNSIHGKDVEKENDDLRVHERNKPQYKTKKSKVRVLLANRQ